jgi:secreted Zn-dependent insulinase-like peptidase
MVFYANRVVEQGTKEHGSAGINAAVDVSSHLVLLLASRVTPLVTFYPHLCSDVQDVEQHSAKHFWATFLTGSIPNLLLDAWNAPTSSAEEIHPPPPNMFLTKVDPERRRGPNVAGIKKLASKNKRKGQLNDAFKFARIASGRRFKLYHRKCNSLNAPRAIARFVFSSPAFSQTAGARARASLFVACFQEALQETMHQAEDAGMCADVVFDTPEGSLCMVADLAGYTDTLPYLVEVYFKVCPNLMTICTCDEIHYCFEPTVHTGFRRSWLDSKCPPCGKH